MVKSSELQRLRSGNRSLVTLALRDLEALMRSANTQAVTALHDVLPALIDTYGSAAATLSADWYDDIRDAAAARRRFTAIPAIIANTGTEELIGWALATATDDAALRILIAGGTERRVMNFSRDTVTGSSIADPAAKGWERETSGNACDFCTMLASRGAVYSEASADFQSHDHCGCYAVPVFD